MSIDPAQFEAAVANELGVLRIKDEAKRRIAAEGITREKLKALTLSELDALPPANYLVDKLIAKGSLSELIGDSETFKSFFALGLALSIATGCKTFFGKAVVTRGPVLYVAGEGSGGLAKRVHVWARESKVMVDDTTPFHTIVAPLDLRDPTFQAELQQIIADIKPVLIIVDTLHRCIPGADENSSRDIGEVVGFATRVQASSGSAVMFLHHPPKSDPSGRGRGSGSLYNAADTSLSSVLEGGEPTDLIRFVRVSVKKQKDDDKVSFLLRNQIVNVYNKDGSPRANETTGVAITSCVLVEATEEELASAANTKGDHLAQEIVTFLTKNPGQTKTAIRNGVGCGTKPMNDALEQLEVEKRVIRTDVKHNKSWAVEYRIAPPNPAGVDATSGKPQF